MKKYLFLIVLFCAAAASCSKDKRSFDAGLLPGEWRNTEVFADGAWHDVLTYRNGTYQMTIDFLDSESYVWYKDKDDPTDTRIVKGMWQANGNTIFLYQNENSSVFLTLEVVEITETSAVFNAKTSQQTIPMKFVKRLLL